MNAKNQKLPNEKIILHSFSKMSMNAKKQKITNPFKKIESL